MIQNDNKSIKSMCTMLNSSMSKQVTITPTVDQQGVILLRLTADQYDEINRALVSYNKRREINRVQASKRRGTTDPRACKPNLILGYPVAETPLQIPTKITVNTRACKPTLILGYPVSQTPLQIPIRTSFNTRLTPSPNHIVPQVLNLEKSVMG